MATPKSKTKEMMIFSCTLLAVKSPKPMVDSVVMAKYQSLMRDSEVSSSGSSYKP